MFSTLRDKGYSYPQFKEWSLHLLVIVSLFHIDLKYFLYSVIFYIIVLPLQHLIFHEYISHEYIEPRNDIIGIILCVLLFYSQEQKMQSKKDFHVTHHKNWQNPSTDPVRIKMGELGFWKYFFSIQPPVTLDLIKVDSKLLQQAWVKYLDKHYRTVYVIFNFLLFILVPLPWFIVIAIIHPWLWTNLYKWHDYYFHGPFKGKDNWLLFPFFAQSAWHIEHHTTWTKEHYGNKFWKYANIAYYVRLLCFKP